MKRSALEASRMQKTLSFILSLFALVASGFIFSPENIAFFKVSPHPYIVASIVLSSFYGFSFAINFSIVSSAIYLLLVHYQVDYQRIDSVFTLDYLSLPILMVLISVVLGELKTRSILYIRSIEKELDESNTSSEVLLQKVKALSADNYDLKKKLLNKLDTFKSVMSLTRGFQSLKSHELIDFYFESVQNEVNARVAGFYLLSADTNSFSLVKSIGNRQLRKSFSAESPEDELIKLCLDTCGTVSIRDLYQSTDYIPADKDQSLLCSPVYLNEELYGVIVIYDLPFLDYVPSNFALLEILTQWLERSLAYAHKFSLLTTNSIFNNQLEVYTYQYFKEKLIEDYEAAKRYKIEHYLLTVVIESEDLSDIVRKFVAQVLKTNTRKTDVVTEGIDSSSFCVLVPFTDKVQIELLREKLLKAIVAHHATEKLEQLIPVKISTSALKEACVDHGLIGAQDA